MKWIAGNLTKVIGWVLLLVLCQGCSGNFQFRPTAKPSSAKAENLTAGENLPGENDGGTEGFGDSSGGGGSSGGGSSGGGSQNGTIEVPGFGSLPALPPVGSSAPRAGQCLQITAISDAGGARTIEGIADANGVVTALAPTGGSTWVFRVLGAGISEAYNCWSDASEATHGSNAPNRRGVELCKRYGFRTDLWGYANLPISFEKGYAKDFRMVLPPLPCGTIRATTQLASDFTWFYMGAYYDAVADIAALKIIHASYGTRTPDTFQYEMRLRFGECKTARSLFRRPSNAWGESVYTGCFNSNKRVSVTFDGIKKEIDFSDVR